MTFTVEAHSLRDAVAEAHRVLMQPRVGDEMVIRATGAAGTVTIAHSVTAHDEASLQLLADALGGAA